MGSPWPLSAPGEGLFLRLAALMMFLASNRWLALVSWLMMGDWHLVSHRGDTGEVVMARWTGLGEGALVVEGLGDQTKLAGPSGLLNLLVKVGVLDAVGVAGVSFLVYEWKTQKHKCCKHVE